jgi:hypothetical protein
VDALKRTWPLIVIWALVLGIFASLIADWGEWARVPLNIAWRVLIAGVGGVAGLILNYFAGTYVGMATNVIESTNMIRFSGDTHQKIENTFIFVGALVGAILAAIFIL